MSNQANRGFTLVELLIVVAIIGVLVALLLPAVTLVQDAASRMECSNNLRQMGLAMYGYEEVYGCFPPSRINPGTVWAFNAATEFTQQEVTLEDGSTTTVYIPVGPAAGGAALLQKFDFYAGSSGGYKVYNHTGFTLLLPFLGEDLLYQKYDFKKQAGLAAHSTLAPDLYGNSGAVGAYTYSYTGPDGQIISGSASGSDPNAAPLALSSQNLEVVGTYVKLYHCPADMEPAVDTDVGGNNTWCMNARRSNYLFNIYHGSNEVYPEGVPVADWIHGLFLSLEGLDLRNLPKGMFGDNRRTRTLDVVDGLSNTIAIGETRQEYRKILSGTNYHPHWGVGHEASVSGYMRQNGLAGPYPKLHINFAYGSVQLNGNVNDYDYYLQHESGFGSWHRNGANFLLGDGSVHFLTNRTSYAVFDALGSMAKQETLPLNW